MAIVLSAAAWMSSPSHAATPEEIACGEYRDLLGLDEAAYALCLSDSAYRDEIAISRQDTWVPAFVERHNAGLAVMAEIADPDSYQPVASLADLPDEFSKDRQLLGQRYAIEAILFYEKGEMLPGLPKGARLFNPSDAAEWPARADVTQVTAGQKAFLDGHCWINLGGLRTSACQGTVYLEVGPSTLQQDGIALYLVGADLAPADAAQVIQALETDRAQ